MWHFCEEFKDMYLIIVETRSLAAVGGRVVPAKIVVVALCLSKVGKVFIHFVGLTMQFLWEGLVIKYIKFLESEFVRKLCKFQLAVVISSGF